MNSLQQQEPIVYVACEGDTLESVAARFGSTPSQLRQLNNCSGGASSQFVYPGAQLLLPGASSPSPSCGRFAARLHAAEGEVAGQLLARGGRLTFEPSSSDRLVLRHGRAAFAFAGAAGLSLTEQTDEACNSDFVLVSGQSGQKKTDWVTCCICAAQREPNSRSERRELSLRSGDLAELSRILVLQQQQQRQQQQQQQQQQQHQQQEDFCLVEPDAEMLGWQLVDPDKPSRTIASANTTTISLRGESRLRLLREKRLLFETAKRLPARLEAQHLRPVHRSWYDGLALSSLLRAAASAAAVDADSGGKCCLLLLGDTDGGEFGAFLNQLPLPERRFVGNGEAFALRLLPRAEQPEFFPAAQDSGFPCLCALPGNSLQLGAKAVWLHHTLQFGCAQPCATFACPQLSASRDFRVALLELWLFDSS